jgi:[ribosomal protein S5]-alanine N-acetyltransferase
VASGAAGPVPMGFGYGDASAVGAAREGSPAVVGVPRAVEVAAEVVVLVSVDERTHEAARAGSLRTDGVDELVSSVIASVVTAPSPPAPPWGTYLGVDPDTNQVVGSCGFRGEPRAGRVEIAFWTFPPFEGRGWATAMTRELLAIASERREIQIVLAHTLPERDPSTSVLRANGLRHVGAVRRDATPADGGTAVRGRVWRWEHRARGGW